VGPYQTATGAAYAVIVHHRKSDFNLFITPESAMRAFSATVGKSNAYKAIQDWQMQDGRRVGVQVRGSKDQRGHRRNPRKLIGWNRAVKGTTRGWTDDDRSYTIVRYNVRGTVYFTVSSEGQRIGDVGTLGLAKELAERDAAKRRNPFAGGRRNPRRKRNPFGGPLTISHESGGDVLIRHQPTANPRKARSLGSLGGYDILASKRGILRLGRDDGKQAVVGYRGNQVYSVGPDGPRGGGQWFGGATAKGIDYAATWVSPSAARSRFKAATKALAEFDY